MEHGEQTSHLTLAPQAMRDIVNRMSSRISRPETPVVAITSGGARYFLRQIVEAAAQPLLPGAQRDAAGRARAVAGQLCDPGLQKDGRNDDRFDVRHERVSRSRRPARTGRLDE